MANAASPELGTRLKVLVTEVNSEGNFFVQLDTEEAYSVPELSERIASTIKANRPTFNPIPGTRCFALSAADDSWYRAVVLEGSKSSFSATVYFVDYGNVETDLPLTRLAPSSDEIFELPYQAVKCQLAGFVPTKEDWSREVVGKLRQFVLNQEFPAVFHSSISLPSNPILNIPCYRTSLFWEKDSDVTVAAELIAKGYGQPSLFPITQISKQANAYCSYIDTPGSFWIHLSSSQDALNNISVSLNSNDLVDCGTIFPTLNPEYLYPGVVCCTQFADDQQFYRSTILSYPDSDGMMMVLFSDYGNTSSVNISDAFVLPSSLLQYPALASKCRLSGPLGHSGSWTDQVFDAFATLLQDQEFQVTFLSQDPDGCYVVEVRLSDGREIGDVLGFAASSGAVVPCVADVGQDDSGSGVESYQQTTLEVGQRYSVYVTLADSPDVVWCQLVENTDLIGELTERMAASAGTFSPLAKVCVNQPCCILYSQDQAWYRALVQLVDEQEGVAQVLLVDYGNIEAVPISSLYTLPGDLVCLCPVLAVSFSMQGLTPVNGVWSAEALERFEELYLDQELTCHVVGFDDNGYPAVRLTVNATSQDIATVLVKEGYATATEDTPPPSESCSPLTQTLSKIVPVYRTSSIPIGTKLMVTVTDVISLEQFSCQLLSSFDDLTTVMENIHEHCSSPNAKPVPFVRPGMAVIAPFSIDKGWYRATMLSPNHIGHWSVQFVDYGNQEEVLLNSLIQIEPEFLRLPPQAFTCRLAGSSSLPPDDDSVSWFSEQVLEKEIECVVHKKRQDGMYVVELYSEGKSVHELVSAGSSQTKVTTPKDATRSPQKTPSQSQASSLHSSPGQQSTLKSSSSLVSPPPPKAVSSPPMPTRPLSQRIKKLASMSISMLKLPLNRSVHVCASFVESPSYFSCQPLDQYEPLETIFMEMNKFYSNQTTAPVAASLGTVCAAMFSQDQQWYRAVVISKHPKLDYADVVFLDYGNSDVVPISSLRKLEPQFLSFPCQSVPCVLVDSKPKDVPLDKMLIAEFLEQPTNIASPVPCRLRDLEIEGTISKVKSLTLDDSSKQPPPSPPKKLPTAAKPAPASVPCFQPPLNSSSIATVSFIVSPHEIYCRPLVSSQELTNLMSDLYVYYVEQAKGTPLTAPDLVGSFCAVPYSDGSVYRGKILSVAGDSAQVLYIDYGNTDPVLLADIMTLDQQFTTLAAQSIPCFLVGISSATPSWSSECVTVLMDSALEQDMNVTYLSKAANGFYEVEIFGPDKLSLSELLVMSGMALRADPPQSLSISPTVLRPGSQEDVIVTAVQPDCSLYCQLLTSEQTVFTISEDINSHISTASSSSLSAENIGEGLVILAQFTEDDCWYRSRVISKTSDVVKVVFVDYGNTEELPISRLSPITSSLCKQPAQAILSKLNKLDESMLVEGSHEGLAEILLNTVVTLTCHSVDKNGTHTVDLTSESLGPVLHYLVGNGIVKKGAQGISSGKKVQQSHDNSTQQSDLTYSQLSHIDIQPFSKCEATVSCFESPSNFYCQPTAFYAVLEELQASLEEHYTSPTCYSSLSDMREGLVVAAKFSEDEGWYRAKIKAVDMANSSVHVLFVDYGNSEWATLTNISSLDAMFVATPIQAIPCILTSIEPVDGNEWTKDATDAICELCMACTSVVLEFGDVVEEKMEVKEVVNEQGESVLQHVVASGFARWRKTSAIDQLDGVPPPVSTSSSTKQAYPSQSITPGDCELVYLSSTDLDGSIWVQLDSKVTTLEELNNRIASVHSTGQEGSSFNPVIGAPCCALFTDDDQWYRGTVVALLDEGIQVLFVDFGNVETISPDLICSLKPEFSSVPPFAIHCQLTSSSSSLPPNAAEEPFMLQFLNPLADDSLVWEAVVSLENDSLQQDTSRVPLSFPVIPELTLSPGQTHTVFISVTESPDHFWCQLTSQYDTLEALMATVADFYADQNPPVTIEPGMFCVSQFSDTKAWYRAKILDTHQPDQAEVLFVDYGNREVVKSSEQICGLDERFTSIPCQAFCCSLLPSPQAEYPDDKLEAFFSLDFDVDTFQVTLEKFLPTGKWLVNLTDKSGTSINSIFDSSSVFQSTEINSVLSSSIPASSSELSLSFTDLHFKVGTSVDVFVTCVLSPSSFYCQPLQLSPDLDELMDDITEYMSTKSEHQLRQGDLFVGQACLARYSIDQSWYRARVEDIDESGRLLAKFIDYGNSEYVQPDSVAVIPEQFMSTPCQVLHCMVEEEASHYTTKHIDAFRMMVCEEEQYLVKIISYSPTTHKYLVQVSCNDEILEFSFLSEEKVAPSSSLKKRASLECGEVDSSVGGLDLSAVTVKRSKTPTTDPEESEGESIATGEPLIHAPFKLSLATSEVVDVVVVFVQNPSYICVQRLDCSSALDGLSSEIDQYCSDYADKLVQQSYHPGDFVLAQFSVDSVWYRAQVKNVTNEELYEVQFIDYGNSDVLPSTKLIMCPGNFLDLPVQAIPCSLAQVPSREVWPEIYKQIIDELVEEKVMKVTVVVAGSHGMPATVLMEESETGVEVSQRIIEELQNECDSGNFSSEFVTSTGSYVAAEGNELEEIVEEEEEDDEIFQDNEEKGKEDEKQDQYERALEAAVEALVHRVRTLSLEELEAENMEHLKQIDPKDSDNQNTKVGFTPKCAETEPELFESASEPRTAFSVLTVGERVRVSVVSCNGLENFTCKFCDSSAMQAITQAIQVEGNQSSKTTPQRDMPVLVYDDGENVWYRGLVKDIHGASDKVIVILVDHGISKSLPSSCTYQLSAKLAELAPPQCFSCQLSPLLEADLDPAFAEEREELVWPSHCEEYFKEVVQKNDSFLAEIVEEKKGGYVVRLFVVDSGENILSNVRDSIIARMTQTSQDSLVHLNLEEMKDSKGDGEEEADGDVRDEERDGVPDELIKV